MTDAIESPISVAGRDRPPTRRRRLRPRFGLRTLLVGGVVVSLASAWFGRELYRVRQEDAAIEALLQAGAGIYRHELDSDYSTMQAELKASRHDELSSQLARALGQGDRPKIRFVILQEGTAEPEKLRAAEQALHRLPEIERVTLWGACFDDEDCSSLSSLPRLATVSLRDTSVGGEGVASLASAPELRDLTISDPLDAGALDGISRLKQIRRLTLFNSYATSERMQGVASLPDLESLDVLAVAPRTDEAFRPLAKVKSVKSLDIAYCRLTEADLRAIAAMPRLEELDLTVLSEWNLAPLAEARGLRKLGLSHQATMESIRELSAKLPGCDVRGVGFDAAQYSFRDGRAANENGGDEAVPVDEPPSGE